MAAWGLSPLAKTMVLGFDVEKVQGPWILEKKKYKILAAKVSVVEIIQDHHSVSNSGQSRGQSQLQNQSSNHSSSCPGIRNVFETLVYQKEEDVTNYNNWITGISFGDLEKGMKVSEVKKRLEDLFRMRTIIVMDGDKDFESVGLSMKHFDVIDIKTKLIRENGSPIKLSKLVKFFYDHDIHNQDDIHDPSIDAYWTLRLYYDQVAPRNETPLKISNI